MDINKTITISVAVSTIVSLCAGIAIGFFGLKPLTAKEEAESFAPSEEIGTADTAEISEVSVFFSPHTGSDSNDGSRFSPVETLEKAKEIANGMTVADGEKIVFMEYLMTVNVKTQAAAGVNSVNAGGINMIPFTGTADSYYFKGQTVGTGCDTQKYGSDGSVMFSARYLLKGTDCDGKQCSIFIENNGPALDKCVPTVVSDSPILAKWSDFDLRAIVDPVGGGVDVNMYRVR